MTLEEHAEAIRAAIKAAEGDGFCFHHDSFEGVDEDIWNQFLLVEHRWNEFGHSTEYSWEVWRG